MTDDKTNHESGPGPRIGLTDALRRIPSADGKRFATIFDGGPDLVVEIYAPRGADPQSPHRRDELYVIVQGTGQFRVGDRVERFAPGDLLFAEARAVHRFEEFSDDLDPGYFAASLHARSHGAGPADRNLSAAGGGY